MRSFNHINVNTPFAGDKKFMRTVFPLPGDQHISNFDKNCSITITIYVLNSVAVWQKLRNV